MQSSQRLGMLCSSSPHVIVVRVIVVRVVIVTKLVTVMVYNSSSYSNSDSDSNKSSLRMAPRCTCGQHGCSPSGLHVLTHAWASNREQRVRRLVCKVI